MKACVEMKWYLLKFQVKTPKGTFNPHQLGCYGPDSFVDVHSHVAPRQLQSFFPDLSPDELVRPNKMNL